MGTSSPFTRILIVGKSLGPEYVPISKKINAEISLIALLRSGVAFTTLKCCFQHTKRRWCCKYSLAIQRMYAGMRLKLLCGTKAIHRDMTQLLSCWLLESAELKWLKVSFHSKKLAGCRARTILYLGIAAWENWSFCMKFWGVTPKKKSLLDQQSQ